MRRTSRIVAAAVCSLLWVMVGAAGRGAVPPALGGGAATEDARRFMQRQQQDQINLAWLVQGLRDIDKNRSLQLTRDQARKILPIYEKWVKSGTVRIAEVEQRDATWQRPAEQEGQRQARLPGDAAQQRERMAEIAARQAELESDIDKVESYLTAAQIRFVDNLNFDPEVYGLGGSAVGVWAAQGERPNATALQRLRREMQEKQAKLVGLYKDVYELLKQRAR